ncbi:hypothetical protein B0A78_13415 [Flavobacterium columnare NBRC 100251 = ATCC 23463]|uniref:Lysine transporter LysE n=2 Tax=Flavobacterium columnare TaxID=996 RepID=G8XAC5_FLACA|nr:LysE family transporter [Flavobacterium columnare]AEW85983.1 hypothetical protein FCOL_05790 [Flavobacterium columnare ATCC 49512]AMO19787.1 hypothetical protein UN65_04970 [Flavobacterium columnare]ANO48749.1 hypothetical protein Pf1_00501 [Flavobacterium columnare]APT23220.1 hypothetical protein BU993_11675 [Flavobacterium columnare]AUX17719.1 hypothetical protein AQ623_05070 [Flavobacterium columnare]
MNLKIKNIAVGFAISFIGSIPLGYLNIIGLHYYKKSNIVPTLVYLLGVVLVESFVIYFTAKGISKISLNPKLKSKISLFSILFLLLLSYLAKQPIDLEKTNNQTFILKQIQNSPFSTGILFSALNFSQIPFWLSWNVYMLNEKYIIPSKNGLLLYTLGALIGTYTGMLSLILFLDKTTNYIQLPLQKYISSIFISLAIWQSIILIKNRLIYKN